MFYTQIKVVYHWIKETLTRLKQKIVGFFQRMR